MPKYFLEDMIKDKRMRQGTKEPKKIREKEVREIHTIKEPIIYPQKNKSRYGLWLVALFSVGFCLFAFSVLFGKAEVRVNPKVQEIVLNENLSAVKDSNDTGLSFDLVVIDGEESKTILATEEKEVKEVATGTVILYNASSSSPQALNVDTRLEGSNDKIYKTKTKITIPGKNKNGTPGSVEVKIYGAFAGSEYNSTPLDFKIFGFKGTPKYDKFYGRSKGDISGGFIGKAPVISDTEKDKALDDLKIALQVKLFKKATDQTPSGFILFKNAFFLNTDDSNVVSIYNKDKSMTLTRKGALYGILFNEQKLTKKVAEDVIPKYDGNEVFIANIKDIIFTLNNKDNVSFADLKNINFNLSGSAKITWKVDVNKLTTDLLDKAKADFKEILAQYPNIDSADLIMTPTWKFSIPQKPENIKIIVNYPQ
jgi:hypothetical protein